MRQVFGALTGALVLAAALQAGDIDPPGAPAPTTGPEPRIPILQATTPGNAEHLFIISEPGSYYLTRSEQASGEQNGIMVVASGVTIDMMGFELVGVSPKNTQGVFASGERLSISLLNGTVRDWGGNGIGLESAIGGRIQGVHTIRCGRFSFTSGIHAGASYVVESCTSSEDGRIGISVGEGSAVANCTVADNGSGESSALGFFIDSGSTVDNCTSLRSGNDGFSLRFGSVARGCTARQAADIGFLAGAGGAILEDCVAFDNAGDGILTGGIGAAVRNCSTTQNAGNGIRSIGQETLIIGNQVTLNELNGIGVGRGDRVIDNLVSQNMNTGPLISAGITTGGDENHIEGNTVANNERGISTSFDTGNVVIRNVAIDNGGDNYSGFTDNDFGPITTAAAMTSPVGNVSD